MTDRVEPTDGTREVSQWRLSLAQRYGAHGDWVVPNNQGWTDPDPELDSGPLQAFAEINRGGTGTRAVQSGEAFVGGRYVAADGEHQYDLVPDRNDQTVYLGVDYTREDTIIVGPDSDFPSDNIPRIPIYEYNTDSSGSITSVEDLRPLGEHVSVKNTRYEQGGSGAAVDNAKQATNADKVDNIEGKNLVRSDIDDDIEGTIDHTKRGNLHGKRSSGEVERWMAGVSDFHRDMQGGSGRVTNTWNAYYDGSSWRYSVSNEQAVQTRISASGTFEILTADNGTKDAIVDWDFVTIENGSIDEADHAEKADYATNAGNADRIGANGLVYAQSRLSMNDQHLIDVPLITSSNSNQAITFYTGGMSLGAENSNLEVAILNDLSARGNVLNSVGGIGVGTPNPAEAIHLQTHAPTLLLDDEDAAGIGSNAKVQNNGQQLWIGNANQDAGIEIDFQNGLKIHVHENGTPQKQLYP